MKHLFLLSFTIIFFSFCLIGFKDQQLKHYRVKRAYAEKGKMIQQRLKDLKLNANELALYIRIFKKDSLLELWGKDNSNEKYKLIQNYKICELSGKIGPKRRQGDMQIPEGFYHINVFNPESNFHLSMGINYPNKSDLILSSQTKPGGNIYIHGACVTIGCITFQTEMIKELYVYGVEARNNGQNTIPVTIFPYKLNDKQFEKLKSEFNEDKQIIGLWSDLKQGYDYFESNKTLPTITFLENGRHVIK